MTSHAALLGQITIDSTNKSIRMKENTTLGGTGLATVTLVEGVYFLRGDLVDPTVDFCLALKAALDSHGNVTTPNTYTVTVAFSTDPAAVSAVVTISATGGSSFEILWGDALTTFNPLLIGVLASNTAFSAGPFAGTKSPLSVWIAPEVFRQFEPIESYDVSVVMTRSGRVATTRRGGPYKARILEQQLVDGRRVLRSLNTGDTAATFASFLQQHGDGKRFEFHGAADSSFVLGALSSSTLIETAWHFDEEAASRFAPTRREPGLSLYDFSSKLLGYVA